MEYSHQIQSLLEDIGRKAILAEWIVTPKMVVIENLHQSLISNNKTDMLCYRISIYWLIINPVVLLLRR